MSFFITKLCRYSRELYKILKVNLQDLAKRRQVQKTRGFNVAMLDLKGHSVGESTVRKEAE
jgi:hypothetical protein